MRPTILVAFLCGCASRAPVYQDMKPGVWGPEATALMRPVADWEVAFGPISSMVVLAQPSAFASTADRWVIGQCRPTQDANGGVGIPLVQLNSDFWWGAETTDTDRWVAVVHELGHCELGLDHIEDTDVYGCPTTPMQEMITDAASCIDGSFVTRATLLRSLAELGSAATADPALVPSEVR